MFSPAEMARHALLRATVAGASEPRPSGPELAHWVRGAWAADHLAMVTSDSDLVSQATIEADRLAMIAAHVPALGFGDLALKLAALTSILLRDFNVDTSEPALRLALAAGALADAVVLGAGGPITLPADATGATKAEGTAAGGVCRH